MRIHSASESVYSLLASRRSSSSERQEETKEGRISSTAEISLASSAERTLDFTQMSSREMQEIAQGMFEAGEIDLTELFMLQNAGVPLGRMGESGEFIPYSESERGAFREMPLNYLQLAQDGMETAKLTGGETNPASGYAQWKSLYELLSGKTAGVDLLA